MTDCWAKARMGTINRRLAKTEADSFFIDIG
jgi:hypothetical protein